MAWIQSIEHLHPIGLLMTLGFSFAVFLTAYKAYQAIKTQHHETHSELNALRSDVQSQMQQNLHQTQTQFGFFVERITLIDSAQKRMMELSDHMLDLKDILSHKSTRGAFGEAQLNLIVQDLLPPAHYQIQYTLPNGSRADCALFLPEPTGLLLIDSKFPLEAYQQMQRHQQEPDKLKQDTRQFKTDVKKHILDVANKYIIPGITSDGALLFLPAESLFSEIHAHFPELVAEAHKKRVWLASPNTLMAILTTAQSVLKNHKIREEAQLIREQLGTLSVEFSRFEKRMEQLTRHIKQASQDTDQIWISSRKITEQFDKIQLEVHSEKGYCNVPQKHTTEPLID